jgi:NarL family two-component system response regulator LiaR
MGSKVRVLIVDDHRMFAEALEMLLAGEEGVEIAGAVPTGEEALEVVARVSPHVVLMDIDLPGLDGIEATRRIREMSPLTQVVIITAYQEPAVMARAIEAGACGFVPKTQTADQLVGVIRGAAAGEMVLPTGDIRAVLGKLQAAQRARTDAGRLIDQLTSREIQILQAIAQGSSTREVAESLFISQLTVQTHVKNILAKLGVHSKLEAVTFALRHDVVRIPGTEGPNLGDRLGSNGQ